MSIILQDVVLGAAAKAVQQAIQSGANLVPISIGFRDGVVGDPFSSTPGKTEALEVARGDIRKFLDVQVNLSMVPDYVKAEISDIGIHEGGTNANEPVHSTLRIIDKRKAEGDGDRQLFPTFHVRHDPKVMSVRTAAFFSTGYNN
ncbi:uncharacterized protein ARMOST_20033 [Armillaria ostoyae]|uniref:Uncharacterized protein n=1 Tax=Armillaria ostoyae TaxID=47428 RepID=A0A284S674_ARMOS|nr:uncharacterized protein ARMOST_20033 [Armillaria ostoyae]